uniref:RNB domain-containing ribonuclease n=1 Tax=Pseudacidovorax intermedius TaxID=433924 RepID=UPI0026ED5DE6
RARMSTVYMPGHKITMLPDAVVQTYTLLEGAPRPAVSLYARFDEATLALQGIETKIERVPVVANLRHDQLDAVIDEAWLEAPAATGGPDEAQRLHAPLAFLFRLAKALKAQREVVRGKPESFNRPDYNFRLVGHEDRPEPDGSETVQITTRRRGAPLDLIVSEAMILANSSWGGWLGELGVPALYRSQASLAPGIKVRMGTKALPHAGLGVKSYAWSTSPLRRYTDLVNQWQIIAAARHGKTAALAAPFKPKDAGLFSILSGFDAAYSTYNAYQSGMERFWTLKYLQQHGIRELEATLVRDAGGGEALARADTLPLVLPVIGAQGLPRGARVRLRLGDIDEIALAVNGSVIERLDAEASPAADDAEADEEEAATGALTIAVDVNDAEPEAPAPAPAA